MNKSKESIIITHQAGYFTTATKLNNPLFFIVKILKSRYHPFN